MDRDDTGDRREHVERVHAARTGDATLGESVDAVAAAGEVDPMEMPPLYAVLDPVVLDSPLRECRDGSSSNTPATTWWRAPPAPSPFATPGRSDP